MAQLTSISNSLFDQMLPTFGNPGNNLPVWNEGQKMFISSEYESAGGNRYYKGLRFCDQLAIIETWGTYHTWTYINSVEIYTFDGNKPRLAGKRTFDKQFYDTAFIKGLTEEMVQEYMKGQLKIQDLNLPAVRLQEQAKSIVDRSYKSFLDDDYISRIQMILQLLTTNK
ncbi:hypothetical protein [Macellibacteroides fermentans]|uniref:Uncharacterized protein n=1 Tax=Macellibacteroides fermentans TaxID=879969 RepID=A0A8E1ZV87_9PORP|nr:hypothetical protein [Macellibacteroides fermentans]NYI49039.1 hypothetical protein [Macellibacteroides fermentans]